MMDEWMMDGGMMDWSVDEAVAASRPFTAFSFWGEGRGRPLSAY